MRTALLGTVIGSLALLAGCGGGTQATPPPQVVLLAIQVTGSNASLVAGQSQQMTATGTFSDKSQQNVTSSATWSSSDSTVAAVSSGGMLNAKAAGSCSITASQGSVTGTFKLTVTPALVSIAVTPANVTIAPGTNQQFVATGTFSDGSKQNLTGSVTWSSSNTAAATIGSATPTQGLAHAVAGGTTTITAMLGSISNTASLTVSTATATSISVSPTGSSLPLGLTLQFTATATFSDGSSQDVTNVASWSSSNTSVAFITISGLATAKNVGTTTISASFESASANTSLTVNAANLESISISPANSSAAAGVNVFFTATGQFNDGGTRNITQQVTWTSSNTAIVSVGANTGAGSTLTPGTVTITATLGPVAGSTSVTVTNAKIVSISITPATPTIPTGGHIHFTATGVFDDSSTADLTPSSAWSSNNTGVATVGSSSGSFGNAVGVSAGNATINATFTANGASATGSAPLIVDSGTLTSLSLQPASTLIAPGSAVPYNALGSFSDGTTESMNPYVSWSTSNQNVASVTTGGVATGQSAGTVTITAQSGSIVGTAHLVVESAALSSIQVTSQSSSDPVGINVQFRAIGTFANGDTQDLTSAATWTSSASSIATISNAAPSNGVATGLAPGTTTISAAFAGQVGKATLTVNNATLTSIVVTPANGSIALGSSLQMIATGSFSDGSSINIAPQATWNSSDPGVITVNQFGVASSVASGTSTLKASLDGVSGTTVLTVQ
jgi:predicted transport protein